MKHSLRRSFFVALVGIICCYAIAFGVQNPSEPDYVSVQPKDSVMFQLESETGFVSECHFVFDTNASLLLAKAVHVGASGSGDSLRVSLHTNLPYMVLERWQCGKLMSATEGTITQKLYHGETYKLRLEVESIPSETSLTLQDLQVVAKVYQGNGIFSQNIFLQDSAEQLGSKEVATSVVISHSSSRSTPNWNLWIFGTIE